MALIACPECKREISDRAAACPHCGNPMGLGAAPVIQSTGIQGNPAGRVEIVQAPTITTEATGKGPKTAQLIGMLLIVAAVPTCISGTENIATGTYMGLIGLAIYIYGRFSAWWRHG